MSETFDFRIVAQCTNQLRFVPIRPSRADVGTKLQQAWEMTYYDPFNTPIKRFTEWRDVPTEWSAS